MFKLVLDQSAHQIGSA